VIAALQAANAGDEILGFAAGVYAERIRNRAVDGISVDVALYGGFAGDETTRENATSRRTRRSRRRRRGIGRDDRLLGGPRDADRRLPDPERTGRAGGRDRGALVGPTIVNNSILGNVADFGGAIAIWGYRNLPRSPSPRCCTTRSRQFRLRRRWRDRARRLLAVVRGNVIRLQRDLRARGGIGVWISESVLVARPVMKATGSSKTARTSRASAR